MAAISDVTRLLARTIGVLTAFIASLSVVAVGVIALVLAAGAVATALIAARVEARHPQVGRSVAVSGGRLAYIEAGAQQSARGTVVLLHGASANASDPMESFGRLLAERGFRVLAFDRPGFGYSDRLGGGEAASPAFQAGAIGEALQALGIGPAIVYGHSWGGAPALSMALDRPDRVAALVLAAPVALPFPERPLPWWARLALQPPITRLLSETIAVPLGLYYLPRVSKTVFRPEAPHEDYAETSRAALVLRPGPALANIQDLAGLPAALRRQASRYAGLRLPVTVIGGGDDPVVKTELQAAPLAAEILGARLVILPGRGHMLHVTAASDIVAEIEAMQTRLDRAATR